MCYIFNKTFNVIFFFLIPMSLWDPGLNKIGMVLLIILIENYITATFRKHMLWRNILTEVRIKLVKWPWRWMNYANSPKFYFWTFISVFFWEKVGLNVFIFYKIPRFESHWKSRYVLFFSDEKFPFFLFNIYCDIELAENIRCHEIFWNVKSQYKVKC